MKAAEGWYDDPENNLFVRWWDGSQWTNKVEFKQNFKPTAAPAVKQDPFAIPEAPERFRLVEKAKRDPQPFNVRNYMVGSVMPGVLIESNEREILDMPGSIEVATKRKGWARLPRWQRNKDISFKFALVPEYYQNGDADIAIKHKGKTVGYLTDDRLETYLPFVKQLDDEGRDVVVDGRTIKTVRGRSIMLYLPRPEEFAVWLDTPAHLRRSKPPKLEESGAYLRRISDYTGYIEELLSGHKTLHADATFRASRVGYGDYEGMLYISVAVNGETVGDLPPNFADHSNGLYEAIESGVTTGRVYIDSRGKQSPVNHKGYRVIAFVQSTAPSNY